MLLNASLLALLAFAISSSAQSAAVACASVDNGGKPLTEFTTPDALSEITCTYGSGAGTCIYFSDGGFSSGSSQCPAVVTNSGDTDSSSSVPITPQTSVTSDLSSTYTSSSSSSIASSSRIITSTSAPSSRTSTASSTAASATKTGGASRKRALGVARMLMAACTVVAVAGWF